MTFKAFIDKYNNKFYDMNGYPKDNPFQCMDLMRAYLKEVLGYGFFELPTTNFAKNVYKQFQPSKKFTKVKNTPMGVPQQGDIIFWDGPVLGVTGIAGHVAIFWDGDVNSFVSFDQNWKTGTSCHLQRHGYRGVMGWLRPAK